MIRAYASGIFPMSETATDEEVFWVRPEQRGVIPLDGFHISRSLRRKIRAQQFDIRTDTSFEAVVRGCADRSETWINPSLTRVYSDLFEMGVTHSVECWQGEELVGGIFGLSLGAAFFGESMFSRRTDASKIALAALVARLNAGGYLLFDTQFLTPHLATLGGVEISREDYQHRLGKALTGKGEFYSLSDPLSAEAILHFSTQMS